MRPSRRKVRFALRRIVLLTLALCILAASAGRFGFRVVTAQCPTAPVQQVAIMVRTADGSFVREVRAPKPGEKDFVVCHCQEKRSAQQTGWHMPSSLVAMLAPTALVEIPVLRISWDSPTSAFGVSDPPSRVLIHPPTV